MGRPLGLPKSGGGNVAAMGRITDSLQAPDLSSIVLRTLTPGEKVHAKKADGLTRLGDEWEHILGTRTLPVLSS